MSTFKIYKLHFTAPLHINGQRQDESVSLASIQSDALYAALTSCLAKTGYAIPDGGDLGFSVSSLFPYYQRGENDEPVYFLPMPLMARQAEVSDPAKIKTLKKVRWIDSKLYGEFLGGKSLHTNVDEYVSHIQESYLTHATLPEDAEGSREFVRSEVSQRVTLHSRTGKEDAKPYYVGKILFTYNSGLYFIAEGKTELLDKALNILAQEGLGSDRNVGMGFFEYSVGNITIEHPQKADYMVSLSVFFPESKEQLGKLLDADDVAYEFTRRGGWITTHPSNSLRKNAIYGFLPGSVFHNKEPQGVSEMGKIVNLQPSVGELTPNHPIWRNGRAIMLPINIK